MCSAENWNARIGLHLAIVHSPADYYTTDKLFQVLPVCFWVLADVFAVSKTNKQTNIQQPALDGSGLFIYLFIYF